jgi:hypothetical protein
MRKNRSVTRTLRGSSGRGALFIRPFSIYKPT